MIRTFFYAAAALALASGTVSADVSGKLVLYTSQPNADAQATVDAFTAAHPGVEVEWFREGTTNVMAKLEAEFAAGSPQPDVLLIADSVTMEGLKAQGRLMAHDGADISAYDPATMDPGKFWFSTKLITTGIVYNTAAPMVPASWGDLLKPEAKDQIMMPSPLTSGAATIHMVSLTGHPDLGWEYYESLAEQGTLAQGGNGGVQTAVAGGEKLYGMIVDFLPIRAAAEGAPRGRRELRYRARGDPVDRAEPRRCEGLRRFHPFARGAGTGRRPGLPPRASRGGAAPGLPAALRDPAPRLRPGARAGRGRREQAPLHGDVRRLTAPCAA